MKAPPNQTTPEAILKRVGPLCRYCRHGDRIHGSPNMACDLPLGSNGVATSLTRREPWFDWPYDFNPAFVEDCASFVDRGVVDDLDRWGSWWLSKEQVENARGHAVEPKPPRYWRAYCDRCGGHLRVQDRGGKHLCFKCRFKYRGKLLRVCAS